MRDRRDCHRWRFFNFYLFAVQCMNTEQARPVEKAIRVTVPLAIYPKLAFLAAQAGISVPAFVRSAVVARVVELAFLFRDGAVDHDPVTDSDHDPAASAGDQGAGEDGDDPALVEDIRLPLPCSGAEDHDPLDDL